MRRKTSSGSASFAAALRCPPCRTSPRTPASAISPLRRRAVALGLERAVLLELDQRAHLAQHAASSRTHASRLPVASRSVSARARCRDHLALGREPLALVALDLVERLLVPAQRDVAARPRACACSRASSAPSQVHVLAVLRKLIFSRSTPTSRSKRAAVTPCAVTSRSRSATAAATSRAPRPSRRARAAAPRRLVQRAQPPLTPLGAVALVGELRLERLDARRGQPLALELALAREPLRPFSPSSSAASASTCALSTPILASRCGTSSPRRRRLALEPRRVVAARLAHRLRHRLLRRRLRLRVLLRRVEPLLQRV